MEEEISYQSLRKIQQIEKNSPILSELYTGFYDDLFKHIQMLDERLGKESSSQKEILQWSLQAQSFPHQKAPGT